MSGTRGVTLVEVLAGATIVIVLGVLLIPAMFRSSRHSKVLACADNLKAFHAAHVTWLGSARPGAADLGRGFWLQLSKTTPPLIRPEFMSCPLVDDPLAPPCPYMGPAKDPATLGPQDFLGCDLEPNHSADGKQGGNVLMKSGDVVTDHTGIWGSAVHGGKCKP